MRWGRGFRKLYVFISRCGVSRSSEPTDGSTTSGGFKSSCVSNVVRSVSSIPPDGAMPSSSAWRCMEAAATPPLAAFSTRSCTNASSKRTCRVPLWRHSRRRDQRSGCVHGSTRHESLRVLIPICCPCSYCVVRRNARRRHVHSRISAHWPAIMSSYIRAVLHVPF